MGGVLLKIAGMPYAETNKANFEACWAKKSLCGTEQAGTNKANFEICTSAQWVRVRPSTKSSRYMEIPSQRNDPAVMKSSEYEDEDAEFLSKLELSSNGTPIAMA